MRIWGEIYRRNGWQRYGRFNSRGVGSTSLTSCSKRRICYGPNDSRREALEMPAHNITGY